MNVPEEGIILPSSDGMSRNEYTFLGWSTSRDCNTVSSNASIGEILPAGSLFKTDTDTTLYAIWAQTQGNLQGNIQIAIRADGEAPGEPSIQYDEVYSYLPKLENVNVLDYINPANTIAGAEKVSKVLTDRKSVV